MKPSIVLSLISFIGIVILPACSSVGGEAISQTNAPPTSSPVPKVLLSPIPPEPFDPIMAAATPTTVALPDSTVAPTGAWQTYPSEAGGYTVEYPAGWTVSEQAGSDGSVVTIFTSADNSAGISVIVQSGEFAAGGNSDIPNTRCQLVTVSGWPATRCFDTVSFSTSTTFVINDRLFILAALGKRIDESIYNHFLTTFQVV
jgi:hypothetical protein